MTTLRLSDYDSLTVFDAWPDVVPDEKVKSVWRTWGGCEAKRQNDSVTIANLSPLVNFYNKVRRPIKMLTLCGPELIFEKAFVDAFPTSNFLFQCVERNFHVNYTASINAMMFNKLAEGRATFDVIDSSVDLFAAIRGDFGATPPKSMGKMEKLSIVYADCMGALEHEKIQQLDFLLRYSNKLESQCALVFTVSLGRNNSSAREEMIQVARNLPKDQRVNICDSNDFNRQIRKDAYSECVILQAQGIYHTLKAAANLGGFDVIEREPRVYRPSRRPGGPPVSPMGNFCLLCHKR